MPDPSFRLVCSPSSLSGAPAGWAKDMLQEGEVALLSGEGLDAVNAVAHELGKDTIAVVRSETSESAQDRTVIGYAQALPLVWIAPEFSQNVRDWARDRGPMTLLVDADAPLDEDQRRRIDRFVAILGRQSE